MTKIYQNSKYLKDHNKGPIKRPYVRLTLLYLWFFISKLKVPYFSAIMQKCFFVSSKNVYFVQTKIYYTTKITQQMILDKHCMIVILHVKFSSLRSIIDGVKGNVLVSYSRNSFCSSNYRSISKFFLPIIMKPKHYL